MSEGTDPVTRHGLCRSEVSDPYVHEAGRTKCRQRPEDSTDEHVIDDVAKRAETGSDDPEVRDARSDPKESRSASETYFSERKSVYRIQTEDRAPFTKDSRDRQPMTGDAEN